MSLDVRFEIRFWKEKGRLTPASEELHLTSPSLADSVEAGGYLTDSCNVSRHLRRHLRLWFKLLAHFYCYPSFRWPLDDTQHIARLPFYSARNDLANTTNLVFPFPSNDGCVHAPSLSIGAVGSPLWAISNRPANPNEGRVGVGARGIYGESSGRMIESLQDQETGYAKRDCESAGSSGDRLWHYIPGESCAGESGRRVARGAGWTENGRTGMTPGRRA